MYDAFKEFQKIWAQSKEFHNLRNICTDSLLNKYTSGKYTLTFISIMTVFISKSHEYVWNAVCESFSVCIDRFHSRDNSRKENFMV